MTINLLNSVTVTSTLIHSSSDGVLSYVQAGSAEKSPSAEMSLIVLPVAETQPPSSERVAQAVKQVNEVFTQKGRNLQVWVERDDVTKINVIKLQDKDTKAVISQYPTKIVIAMAEAISQSLDEKGQLLNVLA
jgi:uncharacterized FlaG/YvyC family protein